MTRVALTVILPLLLPTALYLLWALAAGRLAEPSALVWRSLPWIWLAVCGAVLAAAVLVLVSQLGGVRNGSYVPPHVEDGRVVPGHMQPPAGR